ncbi:MAG: class I SAM-dependent methyltransferase [Bacteroidota bacterium]
MKKLPQQLYALYESQNTNGKTGREIPTSGSIMLEEARFLYQKTISEKAQITAEAGLACGASTVAFCQAHIDNKTNGTHFSFDPMQTTAFDDAGLKLVEETNLNTPLKFVPEPSYSGVVNYLLNKNIQIDLAFIDGWHTVDYKIADVFLFDKVLKSGGIMALHDGHFPSTIKSIKYLLRYRDYTLLWSERVKEEKFLRCKVFFLRRIIRNPYLLLQPLYWKLYWNNSSGLVMLRKQSNKEPNYDFFRNF